MQLQYVMLFGLAGHVHSGVVCYYVTWLGSVGAIGSWPLCKGVLGR